MGFYTFNFFLEYFHRHWLLVQRGLSSICPWAVFEFNAVRNIPCRLIWWGAVGGGAKIKKWSVQRCFLGYISYNAIRLDTTSYVVLLFSWTIYYKHMVERIHSTYLRVILYTKSDERVKRMADILVRPGHTWKDLLGWKVKPLLCSCIQYTSAASPQILQPTVPHSLCITVNSKPSFRI